MSAPVVVQGTPVSSPQFANSFQQPQDQQQYGGGQPTRPPTNPPHRGEKQGSGCKDIPFAILFYVNVAAMIAVAAFFGPDALTTDDDPDGQGGNNNDAENTADDSTTREYDGYVYAALICVFLSVMASIAGLGIMMCIPETLIKAALIFVVIMAGIMMLMSILSGAFGPAILGAIFFAISICYARVVWPRIPFATANLVTGITAVRANWGVITYAFLFTALAGLWSILWSVAFVGVFDKTYECDDETNTCSVSFRKRMILLLPGRIRNRLSQFVCCYRCTSPPIGRELWILVLAFRFLLFHASSSSEHGSCHGRWYGWKLVV